MVTSNLLHLLYISNDISYLEYAGEKESNLLVFMIGDDDKGGVLYPVFFKLSRRKSPHTKLLCSHSWEPHLWIYYSRRNKLNSIRTFIQLLPFDSKTIIGSD